MTTIAISILHHKYPALTIDCLESLKTQTFQDFHIYLLIQGASQEDEITLDNLYGNWDKITITKLAENKGFAEGNNINIRLALHNLFISHVLTLNNDTTVKPDFLEQLLLITRANKSHLIQATMMKMDKPQEIDSLGIEFMKSGLTFNIKSPNKILFAPCAGAALYSRELLEKVREEKQVSTGFESRMTYDYFDSLFFAYAEDFDLGFRALHQGFIPLLAKNAICFHKGSATTATMSDFTVYHTYRNLIFALYKNLPTTLWWRYGLFILLGQIIIKINSLKRKQLTVYVSAFYSALKNLDKFKQKRQAILAHSQTDITPYITKQMVDKDYL
jgi:hypothetical protein